MEARALGRVDCEQSVFSLKIRRVLRHGAFWHRERFKPKRDWGETRKYLFFFRLGLTPSFLATRASYPSDFEESKRLLAVYRESVKPNHKT